KNMTKRLVLTSLLLGTVLFIGCGSSSNKKDTSKKKPLSEQGQEIIDKAKEGNPYVFQHQEDIKNGGVRYCTVIGKTVLIDEGTKCTHKATSAPVSCTNNYVTFTGITAKEINIFGYKYICQ
ncbi:MAG: hypothetical protein DSZ09_02615, partial [Sulfurovum sp.]